MSWASLSAPVNSEKLRAERGGRLPPFFLHVVKASDMRDATIGGLMLEILSLVTCGWLLMFNPSADNLKLPITEWIQIAAHDNAAECQQLVYRMDSETQKMDPTFKSGRQRCVPVDAVYPPAPQK